MARTELKHCLLAMLLWPALAHAEIEQRQVVSAIKAESGKGTHSGHYVLRSEQRFSHAGVLMVQKQWNAGGREEGALRSWFANGKPRQLIEYVDGERQGWTRHWRADGSVESECRYVADVAQGECTGVSAKMSYTEDGIEFEMPEQ